MCVQKTTLGVGLIEPNAVIDVHAMMLHVGNNRLQGDLSKIIKVKEENRCIDCGLSKDGRKAYSKNKHWKEEWVDEV